MCTALPLLLLLLPCVLHGSGGAAAPAPAAAELSVLLDLKAALAAASPATFATWRADTPPCRFSGVRCNLAGSVTEIDLGRRSLAGAVPFASLCRLSSLSRLGLGKTGVSGSLTAAGIAPCSNLEFLDLACNSLRGEIPDLSSLRNLKVLNLSGNGFTGGFPWASLHQMPNLYSLSLGDNPFKPTAAFPAEILSKTKLRWLYLSNCSIRGQIPAGIANLTELVNLELARNDLYGEIPPEISKLTGLWQLELYNNHLTGKLPRGLGNLGNLSFFDASRNGLEGDLSEIRTLTKLVSLQLYENNFTGEVPPELGDFRDLVNLSLYGNQLRGELPPALGSWAEFNFIDVSTNMLTGPIPPDMCKRGTMKKLLMLENQFAGAIPATYADCSTLLRFRVSNNSLTGVVPAGIWGLPNVNIIDLAFNQLSGTIDAGIGNAKELSQLAISNNLFSGEIPPEIARATSLVSVDAAYNQLSGDIPASIGDLKALGSVYLQGNRLSGQIPESMGFCSALTQLNLAGNALSGTVPGSLSQLSNLNSLNLSANNVSGVIPESLASLKLSSLDLSGNLLSGPVPPGLAIEAFSGSFSGNPGLCGYKVRFLQPCSRSSSRDASDRLRAILPCFFAGAVVFLAILGYFLYAKRRRWAGAWDKSKDTWAMKSFRVVTFEEQDILGAIRRENLIGKGGSGNVYRVDLPGGTTVAVKHIWNRPEPAGGRIDKGDAAAILRKGRGKAAAKEFDAEVTALSSVRHVNVVKLFCSITSEDSNLLVYEYLPNGSLWDWLHTREGDKLGGGGGGGLDWKARYEVALGSARGLEYLHHGLQRPILHRDVKSSNILLDGFFMPRIADFGLAKMLQAAADGKAADPSSTHTVAGTHGYIAPEYAYTLKVNEKSDVYSFGVVLLELVTGKRPIEPEYGEGKDIVHWAYSKMTDLDGVMSLLDPVLPAWVTEEATRVLRVGVLCTMRLPTLRPSMRAVVQMLEDAGKKDVVKLEADEFVPKQQRQRSAK